MAPRPLSSRQLCQGATLVAGMAGVAATIGAIAAVATVLAATAATASAVAVIVVSTVAATGVAAGSAIAAGSIAAVIAGEDAQQILCYDEHAAKGPVDEHHAPVPLESVPEGREESTLEGASC